MARKTESSAVPRTLILHSDNIHVQPSEAWTIVNWESFQHVERAILGYDEIIALPVWMDVVPYAEYEFGHVGEAGEHLDDSQVESVAGRAFGDLGQVWEQVGAAIQEGVNACIFLPGEGVEFPGPEVWTEICIERAWASLGASLGVETRSPAPHDRHWFAGEEPVLADDAPKEVASLFLDHPPIYELDLKPWDESEPLPEFRPLAYVRSQELPPVCVAVRRGLGTAVVATFHGRAFTRTHGQRVLKSLRALTRDEKGQTRRKPRPKRIPDKPPPRDYDGQAEGDLAVIEDGMGTVFLQFSPEGLPPRVSDAFHGQQRVSLLHAALAAIEKPADPRAILTAAKAEPDARGATGRIRNLVCKVRSLLRDLLAPPPGEMVIDWSMKSGLRWTDWSQRQIKRVVQEPEFE